MFRPTGHCRAVAAFVALGVGTVCRLAAQEDRPAPVSTGASRASLSEAAARFRELERLVALEPDRYDLLCLAAGEGAALGVALTDRDQRVDVLGRALTYGRRAAAADGGYADGRYWLAVVSALLAEDSGGGDRLLLAQQAWEESTAVLHADSLHAGAHHVQGRLHAAVMRMNPVKRFLAQKILGADLLGRARWEHAEHHLRRAAELAPHETVHHLELGVLYQDLGREDEARTALLDAAGTEPRRVADHVYLARARALLEEMDGR